MEPSERNHEDNCTCLNCLEDCGATLPRPMADPHDPPGAGPHGGMDFRKQPQRVSGIIIDEDVPLNLGIMDELKIADLVARLRDHRDAITDEAADVIGTIYADKVALMLKLVGGTEANTEAKQGKTNQEKMDELFEKHFSGTPRK